MENHSSAPVPDSSHHSSPSASTHLSVSFANMDLLPDRNMTLTAARVAVRAEAPQRAEHVDIIRNVPERSIDNTNANCTEISESFDSASSISSTTFTAHHTEDQPVEGYGDSLGQAVRPQIHSAGSPAGPSSLLSFTQTREPTTPEELPQTMTHHDLSSFSTPLVPSPSRPSRPLLSLGRLPSSNSNRTSLFTLDQPPPYSPTHTILPHYFSLEPIPVRSFIIKDSDAMPFLYDFWLCSTTSASRPQSPTLQLQERGLSPQQHQNELKYSIIRPQRTDRTAIPITTSLGHNTDFIPAMALVAATFPARWIWWGTEALQMVVFGRQLKNIIMEWRWKHGRTRIGGPVVPRLVGCSFRVTPERRYCWKVGSGRRRANHNVSVVGTERANRSPEGNDGGNSNRQGGRIGRQNEEMIVPARTDMGRAAVGGGWFNSFFTRATSHSSGDVPLNEVRVSASPNHATEAEGNNHDTLSSMAHDNSPLSQQEASADITNDNDDEELGCYHCREESPGGVTGRIVAVYKPGRLANRARDRPATSRRLDIYAEVGERCETAMMLMCMRLDDLFMSIPEQKKGGPFVSERTTAGGGDGLDRVGSAGEGGTGTENVPDEGVGEHDSLGTNAALGDRGALANDQRSEISMLKRLFRGRYTWRSWLKWIVAAILIALVVILVLKPKISG